MTLRPVDNFPPDILCKHIRSTQSMLICMYIYEQHRILCKILWGFSEKKSAKKITGQESAPRMSKI